jgi:hypothetical protein
MGFREQQFVLWSERCEEAALPLRERGLSIIHRHQRDFDFFRDLLRYVEPIRLDP